MNAQQPNNQAFFSDAARGFRAFGVPHGDRVLQPTDCVELDPLNGEVGQEETGYEVDAAGTFKDQS